MGAAPQETLPDISLDGRDSASRTPEPRWWFHCFDARNRWCLQEHPEATSGIISLKKSCLVSREKTGRAIGPPQQPGREGFFVQLWSQRVSISTTAPGDGTKAKPTCPCVLYGHEASMWEVVSRAEANRLVKKV